MKISDYQTTEFLAKLDCCGTTKVVHIKPVAILEEQQHECRKTVRCPSCQKIVILQFHATLTTTVVSEEVVDLDEK
jgi:cytochrome c-type biogenesis protein CcmH/NrfF